MFGVKILGYMWCIPLTCIHNDRDLVFYPHMWITNHGNLRMRGFGFISTAPNK